MQTPLKWRPIDRTELRAHVGPAINYGPAGYGLRSFSGGDWIALQGLEDEARAVVAAAQREAERLRAATIVVLDLRGNGGGSSVYGRQLATVLFGDARVQAVLGPEYDASCPEVLRVSARNLARLRSYVDRFSSLEEIGKLLRRLFQRTVRRSAISSLP